MTAGQWWRDAVVYQVYIRSFADGDGDGLGDIAGLRSRLGYLSELGVDAIWITPWYPSPMHDAGYDVADHRGIEPTYGTLTQAEALVTEAHRRGLRLLLDLVPNHTSSAHPWFRAAWEATPGSPERQRYIFRPALGDGPPNDWRSEFGGPAWSRAGGDEWYLHLFDREQPDLNWDHAEVRADFERTLRFWFDRGIDGFRIDVAPALAKDPALSDLGGDWTSRGPRPGSAVSGDHPYWDRSEIHELYRSWRELADSYDPPRVFVAEAWVDGPERLAPYVRPDELHLAFNFDFLACPWLAPALRTVIDQTLAVHGSVGAAPSWVLSNHDVARTVSRFARPQSDRPVRVLAELVGIEADAAVGEARARAAALLMLALPGGATLYQGEELGLPEVEDLPDHARADPIFERSGRLDPGRDGCRIPLPWDGAEPPYGFSTGRVTWLPQPAGWASRAASAQAADAGSVLSLYRRALRIRREHPALGDGSMEWHRSDHGVLSFSRLPGFHCVVNVSGAPQPVPPGCDVLLASGPLAAGGMIPPDTSVWLSTDGAPR